MIAEKYKEYFLYKKQRNEINFEGINVRGMRIS